MSLQIRHDETWTFSEANEVKAHYKTALEMAQAHRALMVEVERLRDEHALALQTIISHCGAVVGTTEGDAWATNKISDVFEAGEKLVEMGLWERVPGHVDLFRPIMKGGGE